jgi:excisionase family DNA binding protein
MKDLMPIAEYAKRRNISVKTARRWIASGQIAAVRIGPRLLYVDPSSEHQRGLPTAR